MVRNQRGVDAQGDCIVRFIGDQRVDFVGSQGVDVPQ